MEGVLPVVVYRAAYTLGAFTHVSPRVEELLGFAPSELTENASLWLSRVHPEDRGRIVARASVWPRAGGPFRETYRLLRRDGAVRWILDEAPEPPDPRAIDGVWTDLTERLAERERRAQLAAELARAREDLGEVARALAHDVRGQLRRVETLGELLRERLAGLAGREAAVLARLLESAARADSSLAGVLRFLEAEPAAARQGTDAAKALEAAEADLAAELREAAAAVTRGALPRVGCGFEALRLVFRALLADAARRRGSGALRIHVSAWRGSPDWELTVSDGGRARTFPADAFALFTRASRDSAAEDPALALCRRTVESWGGRIRAESEPGQGATFRFTVPPEPGP